MARPMRTQDRNPRPTGPRPWALLCAVGLLGLSTLPGCRAKAKNFDNENDTLRRQVMDLRAQNERLQGEVGELRAKLWEQTRLREAATGPAADVVAAMPRCASLEIGARSGWTRDGAGIEVLVETLDARRRFVQVAGTLTVDITRLPAAASPDTAGAFQSGAATIGTVTLTPADLREAYRSTFMGTHYSVVVPIAPEAKAAAGTIVLRAALNDGVTGQTLEGTRTLTAR